MCIFDRIDYNTRARRAKPRAAFSPVKRWKNTSSPRNPHRDKKAASGSDERTASGSDEKAALQ
jgi:hypothetical protein